jgi:dCTP deaminase
MSILSDRQIAERCGIILHDGELPTVAEGYLRENLMIDPFYPIQQRYDQDGDKVVSFGLSSFGYDVRLAPRFKLFTNTNSAVVDPLNINDKCFVDVIGDSVLIPPNSYLLGHTMESFRIPRDVQVVCLGKSTYARCGAIVNVTPIEPGFEGQVVIEISNATPLPVRVYANQGIAQFLFFQGSEPCVISYADRGGKYQGQTGIQLALG